MALTAEQEERLAVQCAKIARQKEEIRELVLARDPDEQEWAKTNEELIVEDAVDGIMENLDPSQIVVWNALEEHKTVGFISGRRTGKSFMATAYVATQMLLSPNLACVICAPTLEEARKIHFQGETPISGMMKLIPPQLIDKSIDGASPYIRLKNGSTCDFLGAVKPHKGRGHGWRICVFDECNFYPSYDFVENILFAVPASRAGDRQREVLFTTTPSFGPILRKMKEQCGEHIYRVPTWDAIHRYAQDKAWLEHTYFRTENTPTGRREFFAEVSDESDSAAWTKQQYEDGLEMGKRRGLSAVDMDEVIVSIDHSITDKATDNRSETGIIVVGKKTPKDARASDVYIFDDFSVPTGDPGIWVAEALRAARGYHATRLLCEENQGGVLIRNAIRQMNKDIPIAMERATKSKEARSMECRAVGDEGRLIFMRPLPKLAEQAIEFSPQIKELKWDRADATITAVRWLTRKRERRGVIGVA